MALNNIAQLLAHTIDKSGENQKFNAEQLMKINALRSAEYGMNKRAKVTSDRNTALEQIAIQKLMQAPELLDQRLRTQLANQMALAGYKNDLMAPVNEAKIGLMQTTKQAREQGMNIKENIIDAAGGYQDEEGNPIESADLPEQYTQALQGKTKIIKLPKQTKSKAMPDFNNLFGGKKK